MKKTTSKLLSLLLAVIMVLGMLPTVAFAAKGDPGEGTPIHTKEGYTSIWSEGFESGIPSTWSMEDKDGDGFNWKWSSDVGSSSFNAPCHGEWCVLSESYNKAAEPLTPDNWLYLPSFKLASGKDYLLTFMMAAQDYSSIKDKVGVYISINGGSTYKQIGEDHVSSESRVWEEIEVDLSKYAGQTVSLAVVHHNCTDEYITKLDCFNLWEKEGSSNVINIVKTNEELFAVGNTIPTSPSDFPVVDKQGYSVIGVEWKKADGTNAGSQFESGVEYHLTLTVETDEQHTIETSISGNPTGIAIANYSKSASLSPGGVAAVNWGATGLFTYTGGNSYKITIKGTPYTKPDVTVTMPESLVGMRYLDAIKAIDFGIAPTLGNGSKLYMVTIYDGENIVYSAAKTDKVEWREMSGTDSSLVSGKTYRFNIQYGWGGQTSGGNTYYVRYGWTADNITIANAISGSKVVKPTTFSVDAICTVGSNEIDKPENPFVDISEKDWFYDDVRFVYENDLMNGTSSNAFSPNVTTTRGMIVTVLYRLEGKPTVSGACPFDDVKSGSYYEDAITWAAANGIVKGYGNDTFGPDDDITREQMAAILYRYAGYKGYDISGRNSLAAFSDAGKVSTYALDNIKWAVEVGLINGMTNGTLAPQGNATRAQIAAILHRFVSKFVK